MALEPKNPPRPAAPAPPAPLDEVDRAILRVLAADSRLPNNAIAEQVGIAPSTCHGRIGALRERGVILGFHTEIALSALGLSLQAMIAVRLRSHTRSQIDVFARHISELPGVVSIFHVAGVDDYLLHVAVPDSDALRDFVLDHLTSHPAVQHTETSLIFERRPGPVF